MLPVAHHATIRNPRGALGFDLDYVGGWTTIPRGVGSGFKLTSDGTLLWINGFPGAGVIEFDTLELIYDRALPIGPEFPKRTGWKVDGNKLTIGRGSECIVAQGVLPIRTNYRAKAPSTIPFGPREVHWTDSMRRDLFGPLTNYLASERTTGLWAPVGAQEAAPTGAGDRATVPGYEQDGPGLILKSDLIMERMPIACVDPTSGEPMQVRDDGYAADGGWGGAGKHQAFKPYHTSVAGSTCSYRDYLSGVQRDAGFGRFDTEHSGNAFSHFEAAALCGDQAAGFYERLLSNDISMAKYGLERMARGGRAYAWTGMVFLASKEQHDRAMFMRDELIAFGRMRAPSSYPFNPKPTTFGGDPNKDWCQLMEDMITLSFLFKAGAPISLFWDRLRNSPAPLGCKFIATGERQSIKYDRYQDAIGPGDYFFPWILYGLIALYEGISPELANYLVRTVPPNDNKTYSTLRSLRDALRVAQYGREQTALLYSVLDATVGP